jgi:hypothetical protein
LRRGDEILLVFIKGVFSPVFLQETRMKYLRGAAMAAGNHGREGGVCATRAAIGSTCGLRHERGQA